MATIERSGAPVIRSGDDDAFVEGLRALIGEQNVEASLPERTFFSTDIFVQGVTAEVVAKPGSIEELSRAVAYCTGAGRAVIPRGGGFSYTQGYIPVRDRTVTFDLRRMNRIVEIDTQDLWVKVEVGATWRQLYDALREKGYRTPYFGPLSGYHSTVGGALSQGSFFLGSTQHGTTADTALGLDVVLADGSVVTTGSAGSAISPSPFMKNYGPDLTGLFLHDAGALGMKAAAYMKLMPFPQHHRYASFAFDRQDEGIAAMSGIAREGVCAECYLWDPVFVKSAIQRGALKDDLRFLKGLVSSGSSLLGGMKDAARIALAGRKIFEGDTNLLHVVIDDVSDAGAEERLKIVQKIAAAAGGGEVENSIPRAMRGSPLNDFFPISYRDQSVRNLPTHGLFPHSKIREVAADVLTLFDDHAAEMASFGITQGTICFAVGSTIAAIEPLFYWTDSQLAAHDRVANRSDLDRLAQFEDRPAAAAYVVEMRRKLIDMFTRHGSAHVQIGKSYRYAETRQPATLALLRSIKDAVDPHGLMNPGSLGLATP